MAEKSHEVWARRKAAWEALIALEKQHDDLYEQGPLSKVLAKDSNGNPLVADEDIPGLFFHDGPTNAADILTFIRLDGDPLILEDFGAYLMRQAAQKDEGRFDLANLVLLQSPIYSAFRNKNAS
jgi:hypothetical protein